jgi:hypothetical protein
VQASHRQQLLNQGVVPLRRISHNNPDDAGRQQASQSRRHQLVAKCDISRLFRAAQLRRSVESNGFVFLVRSCQFSRLAKGPHTTQDTVSAVTSMEVTCWMQQERSMTLADHVASLRENTRRQTAGDDRVARQLSSTEVIASEIESFDGRLDARPGLPVCRTNNLKH